MNRYSLLAIAFAILFSACKGDTPTDGNNSNISTDTSVPTTAKTPAKSTKVDKRIVALAKDNPTLREVSKTISNKVGHNMISSMELDANNNLTINFFEDAAAYNKAYEGERAPLDDKKFTAFWNAGSRVEKAICGLAANVLYDHQDINSVRVNLSTGSETKNVNITKEGLTKVTGLSWEQLKSDWTKNYTNVVLHDPEKREYVIRALSE